MTHARRNAICPLIATLAGVIMLARAASTMGVFNDTYDEPFHIAAAATLVESGRLTDGIETPPVSRIMQGIAMYSGGVRTASLTPSRTIHDTLTTFDIGTRLLLHGRVPYWRTLTLARSATLLFGAVALFYVYQLGRFAGGPIVGMFATIFCSTDPTLMAHTALATSDAAAAAAFVAGTYHLLRWIFSPNIGRAVGAGVAIGVAIGTKFSCLVFGPILLLWIAWRLLSQCGSRRASHRGMPHLARRFFGGFVVIAIVGVITLWASYLFDIGILADSEMLSVGRWQWMNTRLAHIPIPMPSLPLGFLVLQRHNHGEHVAYLMGTVRDGGWWYYFPIALALKSPTALAAGLIAAIGLVLYRVRRPRVALALAVPIVVFLAVSMLSSLQIGVRYLLPLIPLIYVFVCLQLCRTRWFFVLMVLIAMSFVETGARHPDYLSFLNLAGRAASRSQPVLLDSNLDWGQDVARLDAWLRANHPNTPYETRICCSIASATLPGASVKINQLRNLQSGLLIVNKNVKYGVYNLDDPRPSRTGRRLEMPDFIYTDKPIAVIGDTIEVYEINGPTVKN